MFLINIKILVFVLFYSLHSKQNKAPQQCDERTAKRIEIVKSIGEKIL